MKSECDLEKMEKKKRIPMHRPSACINLISYEFSKIYKPPLNIRILR